MNIEKECLTPQNQLPDIIAPGIRLLFIGYNPGIHSAAIGHHYAGPGNRFWKLLHESGLTPSRLLPEDDRKLLLQGYGSTNIADRPTRSAGELKSIEFQEGARRLAALIREIKPRVCCYVGIGVYRAFASNLLGISPGKLNIHTGLQASGLVENVHDYVCSNPSGLNTIPYEQQLECLKNLKKLLDSLKD